jgi:hypothetical protein
MKLTAKRLKQIIKEVLSEYSGDDAMMDMEYGTDSRMPPKAATPAAKPDPEQVRAKLAALEQAAMEGDPDAIAMLMDYGE